MKLKDIDNFERVKGQITQFHVEISTLSKSKPDNLLNKFKLKFINACLIGANGILTGSFKPLPEFDTFDEASLPSNSDVLLVLSQYLDGLESWRCANIYLKDYHWYWNLDDDVVDEFGMPKKIETEKPTRFRNQNSE